MRLWRQDIHDTYASFLFYFFIWIDIFTKMIVELCMQIHHQLGQYWHGSGLENEEHNIILALFTIIESKD